MKKPWIVLAISLCLLLPGAAASGHVHIIVQGLGGTDEFGERFTQASNALQTAHQPTQTATGSAETATSAGGDTQVLVLDAEQSSRAAILELFDDVASRSTESDFLSVTLIGHGTYDGEHYKFNIRGQDLTDSDLKSALNRQPAQRQLIVVATSSSGVLLKTLERSGRIVVTATKSGGETNVVTFPTHWADALSTGVADFDRNEIITVAEAFRYATTAVENHFEEQGLLASEHARLVGDNSDGQSLVRIGALRNAAGNPVVEQLLQERLSLQAELETLRTRKTTLSRDEYYAELEQLMLNMARLQQTIDHETGWADRNSGEQGS